MIVADVNVVVHLFVSNNMSRFAQAWAQADSQWAVQEFVQSFLRAGDAALVEPAVTLRRIDGATDGSYLAEDCK